MTLRRAAAGSAEGVIAVVEAVFGVICAWEGKSELNHFDPLVSLPADLGCAGWTTIQWFYPYSYRYSNCIGLKV